MEYKVYFNLNYMGIVKCDKDFKPYVPSQDDLVPLLEFHYGIMHFDKAKELLHLLERIADRLNNNSIKVKPYSTHNNCKFYNLP